MADLLESVVGIRRLRQPVLVRAKLRGGCKTTPLFPMHRRNRNLFPDDERDVAVADGRRRRGFVWWILRCLGQTALWVLTLTPGLLIMRHGVMGICRKQMTGGKMRTTSYGDDAVGWGWLFIAIGFWALGQCCALKTGRAGFKSIGWILAVGTGSVGVWVLLRRFI